jgi:NADPH:quinone reductase-like Zn-dependent oxidoreductase
MALLPGGGYAEEACVDHGSVIPLPDAMSYEEGGAFPEVFLTAFSNLFMAGLGALGPHESALVHGGGGGVGTAAILLMREEGRQCFVTVGSRDKAVRCLELGATAAIDYKTEDFSARVREADRRTRRRRGARSHRGATCRRTWSVSRWTAGWSIGLMGGAKAEELNLAQLLVRRLRSSARRCAAAASRRRQPWSARFATDSAIHSPPVACGQ